MMAETKFHKLLSQAKEHKYQLLCSLSYYFTFIGLGISMTGFGPTLLELAALTHSNETQMGYIFTTKGFGERYDRFDGHKLLFIAIAASSGLFIVVPFVTSIWGQGIVWCAIGFCTGSVDTGANTLIVWLWKEKVNPFMQLLHFAFGVGALLSPLVLAALHEKSLFIQYLALGIPFGAAAIPVLFNKSPTNVPTIKEVELKEEDAESSFSVDNSFSVDGENDDQVSLDTSTSDLQQPASTSDLAPSLAKRLRIEVVVFAALLLLLDVVLYIGYGGWLATYAQKQLNFTKKDADYVTSVFWGTFTFGRAVAVGASMFLTAKTMLFTDIIGCSVTLVVLLLFSNSALALWMCSMGFGFFIASVFPTVISLPQNLGVEVTGTDTSWMVVGASFGEMVVPLLIGVLQDHYSLTILIVVVLAVEIMGGIVFSALLIRVKYLKDGLNGSITSLIKQRVLHGEKFSKLNEVINDET